MPTLTLPEPKWDEVLSILVPGEALQLFYDRRRHADDATQYYAEALTLTQLGMDGEPNLLDAKYQANAKDHLAQVFDQMKEWLKDSPYLPHISLDSLTATGHLRRDTFDLYDYRTDSLRTQSIADMVITIDSAHYAPAPEMLRIEQLKKRDTKSAKDKPHHFLINMAEARKRKPRK